MNEEHRGSTRAFAGRFVDELELRGGHVVEGRLRAGHAECDVRESASTAILVDQFLNR